MNYHDPADRTQSVLARVPKSSVARADRGKRLRIPPRLAGMLRESFRGLQRAGLASDFGENLDDAILGELCMLPERWNDAVRERERENERREG